MKKMEALKKGNPEIFNIDQGNQFTDKLARSRVPVLVKNISLMVLIKHAELTKMQQAPKEIGLLVRIARARKTIARAIPVMLKNNSTFLEVSDSHRFI